MGTNTGLQANRANLSRFTVRHTGANKRAEGGVGPVHVGVGGHLIAKPRTTTSELQHVSAGELLSTATRKTSRTPSNELQLRHHAAKSGGGTAGLVSRGEGLNVLQDAALKRRPFTPVLQWERRGPLGTAERRLPLPCCGRQMADRQD